MVGLRKSRRISRRLVFSRITQIRRQVFFYICHSFYYRSVTTTTRKQFSGPRCPQKPNATCLGKRRQKKRVRTKTKTSPPNKKSTTSADIESKENIEGKCRTAMFKKQTESEDAGQLDGSSYSLGTILQ